MLVRPPSDTLNGCEMNGAWALVRERELIEMLLSCVCVSSKRSHHSHLHTLAHCYCSHNVRVEWSVLSATHSICTSSTSCTISSASLLVRTTTTPTTLCSYTNTRVLGCRLRRHCNRSACRPFDRTTLDDSRTLLIVPALLTHSSTHEDDTTLQATTQRSSTYSLRAAATATTSSSRFFPSLSPCASIARLTSTVLPNCCTTAG